MPCHATCVSFGRQNPEYTLQQAQCAAETTSTQTHTRFGVMRDAWLGNMDLFNARYMFVQALFWALLGICLCATGSDSPSHANSAQPGPCVQCLCVNPLDCDLLFLLFHPRCHPCTCPHSLLVTVYMPREIICVLYRSMLIWCSCPTCRHGIDPSNTRNTPQIKRDTYM